MNKIMIRRYTFCQTAFPCFTSSEEYPNITYLQKTIRLQCIINVFTRLTNKKKKLVVLFTDFSKSYTDTSKGKTYTEFLKLKGNFSFKNFVTWKGP